MEKDLNNSVVHNSSSLRESETDKSFVGKVKSILHNTPLSKWFQRQNDNRPVTRRRDETFEDDDTSEIQPPLKRVKLPANSEGNNCDSVLFNESCAPSSTHNASNSINAFNKIPEPVAGPSGVKPHKLVNSTASMSTTSVKNTFVTHDLVNGHSDSEESTSGYSSVARTGSKEQVCGSQESSKHPSPTQTSPSNPRSLFHKANANPDRSLFADRSLSPNTHTSLSSRRPNFNVSTFGSPSFIDKTISTERAINSPFYNGRTIYGGASAYGRRLGRSSQDLKTSLRNPVEIKPVNKNAANGNLVLGKTARRILDTIAQYSSPISDAKKIPIISKKARYGGLLTKYSGANPYFLNERKVSSNTELQVPTVPELLKMKARLQESTESVRHLASSSKSDLNAEYYNLPGTDNKERHTGKIKTKVASVRQKNPNNETVSQVKLTPVSLPITTLPKFDFVVPPPLPAKSTTVISSPARGTARKSDAEVRKTVTEIVIQKETRSSSRAEYKFSEPVIVAENVKSIVAINNFKFSEPPVCTKDKSDPPAFNFKMPESKTPIVPSSKMKQSTPALRTGSVMDVLLGKKNGPEPISLSEKFKPPEGTWECPVCMIRNSQDKMRCAACETPKAGATKPPQKDTFGSQFKLSTGKWECTACMLHNNDSESKCVSCTTPKPGSKMERKENSSATTVSSGFGDKFKLPSDTWECGTCMIRNKKELTKCAACETPNPKAGIAAKPEPSNGFSGQTSGFGNAFKAKSDEWECGTCMVRNKASNTKCLCCETPNPKCASSTPVVVAAKDTKPISAFNFGIDKASATTFKFGIPPTAANPTSKTGTLVPSIFGGNTAAANATEKFSFGIPASTPDKPKNTEVVSQVQGSSVATSATTTNPLLNQKEPEPTLQKAEIPATPTFKFGGASTTPVPAAKETEQNKTEKAVPTFTLKPAATNGDISKNLFPSKPNSTANTAPTVTTSAVFSFGAKPAAVAAPLLPSTQTESSKPMFKFGSSSQNSFASPTTSMNNGLSGTKRPSFGTSSTAQAPNPTEVKPFTFNNAPKDPSEPAAKMPMFQFGQTAASGEASTTKKTPGFNFGPATTPTFNFASGKTDNGGFNATPASGSNLFGGSANTTSQNGTFNFGTMASNNNQKAGFSFGAPVNSSVPSGSQSGFNFGASATTQFAPPSGGFNFSGAVPAFNASAKPSFNFTDGNVAAFSAQPASVEGGVQTPRKIKRAVRRTQR